MKYLRGLLYWFSEEDLLYKELGLKREPHCRTSWRLLPLVY
jgi:hypothetical protein